MHIYLLVKKQPYGTSVQTLGHSGAYHDLINLAKRMTDISKSYFKISQEATFKATDEYQKSHTPETPINSHDLKLRIAELMLENEDYVFLMKIDPGYVPHTNYEYVVDTIDCGSKIPDEIVIS